MMLGETVTMHIKSFDAEHGAGRFSVLGAGMAPFNCERPFTKPKADQKMFGSVAGCLPNHVNVTGLKYCSDQGNMVFEALVYTTPHRMILRRSQCPSLFLETASKNDMYSHSAWIWNSQTCTGSSDPPTKAPFCFTGSKMGEIVSIKVNKFDKINQRGSVYVTGSGMSPVKCNRVFEKSEQFINVRELEKCLPSSVKPKGLKYCSDQNSVVMTAQVGPIDVEINLIAAPCPSFLLDAGSSILQDAKSEWIWDSVACTGVENPPSKSPFCYTGTKMGEEITIKVSKFNSLSNMGSVMIGGSGLQKIKCQKDFTKSQQLVQVQGLQRCLPRTVKPEGMKFCSDQNHVILDAHVGPIPVEMVLKASPCPEAFIQKEEAVMEEHFTGQILPSGQAVRMVRAESA
jgi:hypothetical protein